MPANQPNAFFDFLPSSTSDPIVSLCRKYVEAHAAKITIKSSKEMGIPRASKQTSRMS